MAGLVKAWAMVDKLREQLDEACVEAALFEASANALVAGSDLLRSALGTPQSVGVLGLAEGQHSM